MPTQFASYLVEVRPASTWQTVAARDVLEVSGLVETSGNRENPLSFGDNANLNITVRIRRGALASVPDDMPIRVTFTITSDYGTFAAKAFVGIVTKAQRSLKGASWTLRCESVIALINKVREDSPVFARVPIALQTTSSSPTALNNSALTPLEWVFLKAGGWPAQRSFENTTALFYYDLDTAPFAPDAVWFSGEKGFDEALKLVKAAGGQLYVGADGVVRYRQPLSFNDGTPTHTFSDIGAFSATQTLYGDCQEAKSTQKKATRVQCAYVGRRVYPLQNVVEDTESRFLEAGAETTVDLVPQQPLDAVATDTGLLSIRVGNSDVALLAASDLLLLDGNGVAVAQASTGGYLHSLVVAAQRLVLTIQNTLSHPLIDYRIVIRGMPIGAAASGKVVVGSGTETLDIPDTPYVQRRSHAERLCYMYLAFFGVGRRVFTLTDCPFDPRRVEGEIVYLTCQELDITSLRCRVVAIQHDKTGAIATYVLVDVSDLPASSDYYQIGTTDYAGQTLRLAY